MRRNIPKFIIFVMSNVYQSLDVDDSIRRGKEITTHVDANSSSRSNKAHVTLLSRQYHYVLPMTLAIYVTLQFVIGSRSDICSHQRQAPSDSTITVYYCAFACFFISGLQQAIKIHSYRNQALGCMSRSIFFAGMTISFIAGSSSYLTGKHDHLNQLFSTEKFNYILISTSLL